MTTSRIAFLDVDGTIIDADESIAPSTIEAVRTARGNGHLVYLSTGRASVEIYPAIREIGFDGVISAGGGFAEVGDELVIARTMPEAAVTRMIDFYEASGFDFYLQSYDEVYPSPGVRARFASYLSTVVVGGSDSADAAEHPALRAFADVRPYSRVGIAKSIFLGGDPTAYEQVSAELSGDYHVITGTMPYVGSGGGEVTLSGVNKGTTILRLLQHLGLDASASIGIGDSSNDIEMLQVCGVGIAMGNAGDDIKAHADEVTTSVLDDGIWNAFRRHGLI